MKSRLRWLSQPRKLWWTIPAAILTLAMLAISYDVISGFFGQDRAVSVTVVPVSNAPIAPDASQRAIVVLAGFTGSGEWSAKALAPKLSRYGRIVAPNYAKTEFDPAEIYQATMAVLWKLQPTQLVVYGQSMGTMLAVDWLTFYQTDGEPFGPVVLIAESPIASYAQIKAPGWQKLLAKLTPWETGGQLSTAAWRAQARTALKSTTSPDDFVDPAVVEEAHKYSATIDYRLVHDQLEYIRHFRMPQPGALSETIASAHLLHGNGVDPLVDSSSAIPEWTEFLNGRATISAVSGWPEGVHSPLTERPTALASAIVAALN